MLVAPALLMACHPEGRVFVEHQELSPQLEWIKDDAKTFQVTIDEAGNYDMSLGFRYANGYQFRTVRVKVTELAPDNNKTVRDFELKIRDENDDYIGDPGFDIWDSEHLVHAAKPFNKGVYIFTIEHDMPQDPLNFAMEIGLILDEAN